MTGDVKLHYSQRNTCVNKLRKVRVKQTRYGLGSLLFLGKPSGGPILHSILLKNRVVVLGTDCPRSIFTFCATEAPCVPDETSYYPHPLRMSTN